MTEDECMPGHQDGEDLGSGKERAGDEEQAREVHHNSQRSLRSRASIDVVGFAPAALHAHLA